MSSAIGDFSLALASASNKNSLSLISPSFDFALVKFTAAPEFQPFGKALSPKRIKEAEDGRLHVVARKLAALFGEGLPEIPNLSKAYGTRTSEIAKMPSINPQGSPEDGAFRDLVGMDGTTVWAAATSGRGGVAIHLLACMLVRMWKAPEAIAIWTQLIETRKQTLKVRLNSDEIRIEDATAAGIEIETDHLAAWDGSAR
jgi:hypothetical protein